jgi:hypothetical protein
MRLPSPWRFLASTHPQAQPPRQRAALRVVRVCYSPLLLAYLDQRLAPGGAFCDTHTKHACHVNLDLAKRGSEQASLRLPLHAA